MSSYELFVHDPMRPAENSSFQPCDLTNEANWDTGVAKSGVKGPLIVGSRSERFCDEQSANLGYISTLTHYFNYFIVFGTLVRA